MHMDYLGGTVLSYRSGEIPTYIRGTSLDPELWGTTINCGTSAQFKWEEKPTEIGEKLNLLNEIIKADSSISLPRLTFLDTEEDAEKIESLYHQLAVAIEQYDGAANDGNLINVPSFYMMGTRLIQNDSVRFKLSCNHKSLEFDGELSITAINEFVREKEFALQEVIQKINISIEYANDAWTNRKPITEYLEFITEDNFCLRNGKWCSFNIAYLDRIFQEAKRVAFINHSQDEFALSKDDVIQFARENGFYDETNSRQPYETFYNQNISQLIGAICLHPQTVPVGNVKKCAVGKHPKSEKHGNTAQFSEVERSGTQENCGGIESGCRLRLRPLPVLHRRQSQRVARIDPNAVVVDKNIAENDRFDLFSR